MIRVLLADDEKPVRDSISFIIRNELSENFEIIDSAANGREAMEKARITMPDIVLMDVRMPGISGIEAIREMRKWGRGLLFILITAYERFEIAREALELGVIEYLLKPVSRESLKEALLRGANIIKNRRETEKRQLEEKEGTEGLKPFVEEALLRRIMSGDNIGQDIDKYLQATGKNTSKLRLGALFYLGSDQTSISALYQQLNALIKYKSEWIAGPILGRVSAIILFLEKDSDGQDQIDILNSLLENPDFLPFISYHVSSIFDKEAIDNAWKEVLNASLFNTEKQFYSQGAFEKEKKFAIAFRDSSLGKSSAAFEAMLLGFEENSDLLLENIKIRLNAIFMFAGMHLILKNSLGSQEQQAILDIGFIQKAENLETIKVASRRHLALLLDYLARTETFSYTLNKAIAYIRKNYSSPLSLNSLSDIVAMSPGNLSRLFVKETGKGFSDYLVHVRLEKAKEQLHNKEKSVKEISVNCGYADANYFARLFKKEFGLTPSEFRGGDDNVG